MKSTDTAGDIEPPGSELRQRQIASSRRVLNTVREEFAATRPAFRWRQLIALARVTASECGRPAPGIAQAKEMLKV